MAELYEIISGEIIEGREYQVTGGTSIVYNSVTVNSGDFFVGVSGVTTYTKTAGTEIVTYASTFLGVGIGIENDFYLDLFNDESKFLGVSLGIEGSDNYSQLIRKTYK